MSASELKKRPVSKADMATPNGTAGRPKSTARTVTAQEASEWQLDNKYILSGYRHETPDYLELLRSMTFLHNETCNVYTHLIPALLLPILGFCVQRFIAGPQFLNVTWLDHGVFALWFVCGEICMILSVCYHLFMSHSRRGELFWHGMDLLGIVTNVVGTFVSGIYYLFYCEPSVRNLQWGIVSSLEASSQQKNMMLIRSPRS